MGKFVTRLIVVCNVDGDKSANGKIRYALFVKASQVNQLIQSLNQYTHGYDPATSAYSVKGNPRRVTCVRYLFVWCGKCIAQQLPIMGTRLRSVSVVYTGQLYVGVLKGNPRKVACMLCECVKCIRQTIADNIKRDLVNCTNRHWRTIRVIYRYPRPSRISGLFKNCTRGFG